MLARDEAERLPATLACLPPGVGIFVLDAESRDATAEVARGFGAVVETRAWRGFVDARRYALARVRTRWTLMLDADERLEPALAAALLTADDAHNGYRLRRVTALCGRPVRAAGWSNERIVRLFRTERARLRAAGVVGGELHEHWVVDAPLGDLPGVIVHDSYPTLASYRAKFARYTSIEAAPARASTGLFGIELALVIPRFLWSIARHGAWLDGWRGFYVAWMSSCYRLIVRMKALRRAA